MKSMAIIHLRVLYPCLNNWSAGKVTDLLKFKIGSNRRFYNIFPRRELLLFNPLPIWRKRYFELGSFQVMRDSLKTDEVPREQTDADGRHCLT